MERNESFILSLFFVLLTTSDDASNVICNCGKRMTSGRRVIGGSEIPTNYYPWLVTVTDRSGLFCAGTVINVKWILTAAHCVDNTPASSVMVNANVHSISSSSKVLRLVKAIFKSDFAHRTGRHDIALLELTKPLDYGRGIQPVCLPLLNNFEGIEAIVVGWGKTNDKPYTDVPQEARVTIQTKQFCKSHYQGLRTIYSEMMCAMDPEMRMDACNGDSGGPLMIECGEQVMQVGIVSWGPEVCASADPGIYTDISPYSRWIMQTTGHDRPCFFICRNIKTK